MGDIQCPYDSSLCTLDTCNIACGQVTFLPSLGGNAFYAAAFGLLLIAQAFLGIRHRTWGFMVGMICGLVLEVVGYVGRIMLHHNPFDFNNFLVYLIPLTIGPAFLTGAIYLCLARIVVVNGTKISRLSPRAISLIFMISDFFSLVLQGAGGGIAATANTGSGSNAGRYIMIAGLAWQVLSLAVYFALWAEFVFRVKRSNENLKDARFTALRESKKFKLFNYALAIATILIFIRCVYRIVELQGGFTGTVASNQVAFMILEGPMIILAVLVLTILHPGRVFDGSWQDAGWSLRKSKSKPEGELEGHEHVTTKGVTESF